METPKRTIIRTLKLDDHKANASDDRIPFGLPKVAVFIVLGMWVVSCYFSVHEFFATSLTTSMIIACLLFFHTAEQNGDFESKH